LCLSFLLYKEIWSAAMARNIDLLVAQGKISAAEGARRKVQQRQSRAVGSAQKGGGSRGPRGKGSEEVDVDLGNLLNFSKKGKYASIDVFPSTRPGVLREYSRSELVRLRIRVSTSLGFKEGEARLVFGLSQNKPAEGDPGFEKVAGLAGSFVVTKPLALGNLALKFRASDRKKYVEHNEVLPDDSAGSLWFLASSEWLDVESTVKVQLVGTFRCADRVQVASGGALSV